ncbi:YihY/virulence factor BrkB family protein [Aurantiacibacter aquimixticola]|uniref:YihY/virulence factor BrkB family protein n=1 Tax=Aurantiacibacter aquimixticola TaxID=1958945 RepID=A0A419RUY0_9SPHN|nr:YihY/virulence factor BrkB family protein [Aurantiacibacter aquimixticola]RJY09589.1 YihY/virulence factor BrkB family protein [Aurantiacibacter aquimixticola]
MTFSRLKQGFARFGEHNGGVLAAGVAYYAFLAMVPLLAAAVLSYGIFADPQMVANNIAAMAQSLPQSAAELIGKQLEAVVESSGSAKGFGLLLALGLALFGARNAAGALVTAVSEAFEDSEQRSFLRGNLVALAVTLAGVVGVGLVAGALTVTSAITALLPGLSGGAYWIGQAATYTVLAASGTLAAGILYRRGPKGIHASWRRVLPGAILASVGFVLLTAAFGFYVANFGSYNATYGSLGAVIVLLTWLYLVAYVLIFGAEVAAAGSR